MKRGIKVLLLSDAWITLALGLLGPIYALFVQGIGGDILDASWAYFAFLITSGALIYLMGKWENRVKHREKLIFAGYCLCSVGCFSYIFVSSQTGLVLTQIILGVAEAVMIPAFDALYSDYTEKKEEASEWGDVESLNYIVTAIAALIGGYVASIFGFRVLFMVMFAISLFSVFSSLNLFKSKKYLNES